MGTDKVTRPWRFSTGRVNQGKKWLLMGCGEGGCSNMGGTEVVRR